jgi:Protein of unknown function (DUF1059)
MGALRSDRPRDDQKGGSLTPSTTGNAPERLSLLQMFDLACADVHPVGCDSVMTSDSRENLVSLAREHGERAHGFTPVWYSAGRLAAMAEAVRPR